MTQHYDGNLAALEAHDREMDAWLDSRPVCTCCQEPIQDEKCYETERGLMCEWCAKEYALDLAEEFVKDCMDDWRHDTERYVI